MYADARARVGVGEQVQTTQFMQLSFTLTGTLYIESAYMSMLYDQAE